MTYINSDCGLNHIMQRRAGKVAAQFVRGGLDGTGRELRA